MASGLGSARPCAAGFAPRRATGYHGYAMYMGSNNHASEPCERMGHASKPSIHDLNTAHTFVRMVTLRDESGASLSVMRKKLWHAL